MSLVGTLIFALLFGVAIAFLVVTAIGDDDIWPGD